MPSQAIDNANLQLRDYPIDSRSGLILRYLEHHPHRNSVAEMRTCDGAIPVWALVGHWAGIGWDVKHTAIDYEIDEEAVLAAIALFDLHPEIILDRIQANSAEALG